MGRIEARDLPYTAFPQLRRLPEILAAYSIWADRTHARNHHAALHLFGSPKAALPFTTRQYRLEVAMYGASELRSRRLGFRHALAGLQAGVLGALIMFVCLMLGSLWYGRSIWVVPNLFSTTFFGSGAYRNHLLSTSWAGVALIVAIYGLLGTVWGCVWRDERKPWLALYGAIAGLAVYFLFNDFLWRHINPLVTLYA